MARSIFVAAACLGVVTLAGCGGGGDGGAVALPAPVPLPTAISGSSTPPVAPGAVTLGPGDPPDVLLSTRSSRRLAAILQSQHYQLAVASFPTIAVESFEFRRLDLDTDLNLFTGDASYAGDASLGQLRSVQGFRGPPGYDFSLLMDLDSTDLIGTLMTATYCPANCGIDNAFGIVVPFSAAINPDGYVHQTFGVRLAQYWPTGVPPGLGFNPPGALADYWFSAGVPTDPMTLPVLGNAMYSGRTGGNFIDAPSRDFSEVNGSIAATVDFATRTITFSTSATNSLSVNSAAAAVPAASPALNLAGVLAFAAASNTFTGPVTSANGMTGNATCRFYGVVIGVATASKSVGSPPEIGCTYALSDATVGALYGALGAK